MYVYVYVYAMDVYELATDSWCLCGLIHCKGDNAKIYIVTCNWLFYKI